MATATLTYDLDDPEDERQHRCALAGQEALIALERIDERIRGVLKHGEPSEETAGILREIRAAIPSELIELLR